MLREELLSKWKKRQLALQTPVYMERCTQDKVDVKI